MSSKLPPSSEPRSPKKAIIEVRETKQSPAREAGLRRLFSGLSDAWGCWCPPGTFLMGSDDNDPEASDTEKPQREVRLSQGFWMGQTPVTQAQFEEVMGYNPSRFSRGQTASQRPVERCSWYDAVYFCNKLSVHEGLAPFYQIRNQEDEPGQEDFSFEVECLPTSCGYRLPTEAEWEYAARAGTQTSRYGELDQIGWFRGNAKGTTHSVGQKQANNWGLHDMLGNVEEWVWDRYERYSQALGAALDVDPYGSNSCPDRVFRGGSWICGADYTRAADRSRDIPTDRCFSVGFRLSRFG